jgi:hypothetical protein
MSLLIDLPCYDGLVSEKVLFNLGKELRTTCIRLWFSNMGNFENSN